MNRSGDPFIVGGVILSKRRSFSLDLLTLLCSKSRFPNLKESMGGRSKVAKGLFLQELASLFP
jgi:hypothetical protein